MNDRLMLGLRAGLGFAWSWFGKLLPWLGLATIDNSSESETKESER